MEISYIKEFVVLADTENYLEAAEALFISQSSLSKHIKVIEKELGVLLFDRTTRKVRLNEFGKTFYIYAKQIAQLEYEYHTAIMNQNESTTHTLTIGSIPIMAPYHITDAIVAFKNDNRNYSVNLVEGESAQLKDLLRTNKCELAFIRQEEDKDDEFARVPYMTDTLVAVLPSYHPLAKEKEISLEQLKGEDFLLLQPGSVLYNLAKEGCRKAGFVPNITYTGKRAENIIDLIEKGMGISLLMKKPISYLANNKISLVNIKPVISTSIKIYYNKNAQLSLPAKHFINSIQIPKNKKKMSCEVNPIS